MTTHDSKAEMNVRVRLQARFADWVVFLSLIVLILEFSDVSYSAVVLALLLIAIESLVALVSTNGCSAYFMGVTARYNSPVGRVLSTAISSSYFGALLMFMEFVSFMPILGLAVLTVGISWPMTIAIRSNRLPWEDIAGDLPMVSYDGRRTIWYLLLVGILAVLAIGVALLQLGGSP